MVTTSAPPVTDTRETDPGELSRRLLVAAAVATGLAAVTYLLMVRTALGQRFDNAALTGSLQQSASSRAHVAYFLSRINSASFALVLIVIVAFGVARGRRVLGISVAAAALVSVLGTDLLKDGILTRQFLVPDDSIQRANTFPSGHTATAIVCAFALVVLAPPAWRGLVAILAGSYSFVVAADVQTAGWHRPSDAIGAVLVCFAVFCTMLAVLARTRPIGTGTRLTHLPAFALLGLLWAVSMAVAALNAARVLHALVGTSQSAALDHALLNDAYQFSVNLTVAIAATSLITLLLLLGRRDLDAPAQRAAPAPSSGSQR